MSQKEQRKWKCHSYNPRHIHRPFIPVSRTLRAPILSRLVFVFALSCISICLVFIFVFVLCCLCLVLSLSLSFVFVFYCPVFIFIFVLYCLVFVLTLSHFYLCPHTVLSLSCLCCVFFCLYRYLRLVLSCLYLCFGLSLSLLCTVLSLSLSNPVLSLWLPLSLFLSCIVLSFLVLSCLYLVLNRPRSYDWPHRGQFSSIHFWFLSLSIIITVRMIIQSKTLIISPCYSRSSLRSSYGTSPRIISSL